MSSLWERFAHPEGLHAWRWRLLCAWIVAFSIIVGVLMDEHHDQAMKAEREAAQAQVQNARQQATIVQVCDRGYILLGLVEAALEQARVQLKDDLKTRPDVATADVQFIRLFESYHAEIVDQLTSKDSPCVKATR